MNKQTLQYRKYEGSIEPSVDDGCLHGRILFIRDRVIYEGDTVPELEKYFHEAVDEYLETCEELGKEPDKPFSGQFQVRISPDIHRDAARTAYHLGMSLNKFVEKSIEDKLEKQETVHHVHEHKHTVVVSQVLEYPSDKSQMLPAYSLTTTPDASRWALRDTAKTSH